MDGRELADYGDRGSSGGGIESMMFALEHIGGLGDIVPSFSFSL